MKLLLSYSLTVEDSIPKVISWPQISAQATSSHQERERDTEQKKETKEASSVSFKKVSRSYHIMCQFITQWLELGHRVKICFKVGLENIFFTQSHHILIQKLKVSHWEDKQKCRKRYWEKTNTLLPKHCACIQSTQWWIQLEGVGRTWGLYSIWTKNHKFVEK